MSKLPIVQNAYPFSPWDIDEDSRYLVINEPPPAYQRSNVQVSVKTVSYCALISDSLYNCVVGCVTGVKLECLRVCGQCTDNVSNCLTGCMNMFDLQCHKCCGYCCKHCDAPDM